MAALPRARERGRRPKMKSWAWLLMGVALAAGPALPDTADAGYSSGRSSVSRSSSSGSRSSSPGSRGSSSGSSSSSGRGSGSSYSRPAVVYHDGYSPWFWLWLLDRGTRDQAAWVYHHRYSMDAARYDSMLAQNAALREQVRQLESQDVPRDPGYVPPGLPAADL